MSRFLQPLGISLSGRDRDHPRFAPAWETVRTAARASLVSPLSGRDVTDRPAGWGHNYFCPVHSGPLEFHETRPDHHRCAEFGHDLSGPLFDTGWAYVRNQRLLEHLSASAVSAAVTGSGDDSRRGIDILTDLADVYPELPLHGAKVGKAKLMHQSLEEAVAATSLSRSYALVERWMSPEQRSRVTGMLFGPMAQVVQDHLMDRTHNIEVWHMAGLASLAVVLGDRDLAHASLEGRHGLRSQLAEGLRPDGWWYEGSPGYHFYMLTAVLGAVEGLTAMGIESGLNRFLELMLLTPVRTARNDLTVPSFNDSSLLTALPPGLAAHADLYFRGARLCRSAELDGFLGSSLADGFDRSTATYLIYGEPEAEQAARRSDGWHVRRIDVLPDSGYAVLRQPAAQDGRGPDTSVFLKFGPHGGGHGQPDKLEIDLTIEGSRVIADPGTTMYTNPIHRPWFVQTWSHSTILIDRISQPPIKGRLLSHRSVTPDAFGYAAAEITFGSEPDPEGVNVLWHLDDPAPVAAYAGVTMRRVLAMMPPDLGNYLLDVVVVTTPHRRTIDLLTHVRGTMTSPPGRPATDRMLLPQFHDVRLVDQRDDGRTDYLLEDERPWSRWHTGADEVLTAVTPSNPTHQTCATTVERVVGRQALFVSMHPLGTAQPTTDIRISGNHIEFNLGGRPERWSLAADLLGDQPATTAPPLEHQVDPGAVSTGFPRER